MTGLSCDETVCVVHTPGMIWMRGQKKWERLDSALPRPARHRVMGVRPACNETTCVVTGETEHVATAEAAQAIWVRDTGQKWRAVSLPVPSGYALHSAAGDCAADTCLVNVQLQERSGGFASRTWLRKTGGPWVAAEAALPIPTGYSLQSPNEANESSTIDFSCSGRACVASGRIWSGKSGSNVVWTRELDGPWVAASSALPAPAGYALQADTVGDASCTAGECVAFGYIYDTTPDPARPTGLLLHLSWTRDGSGPWTLSTVPLPAREGSRSTHLVQVSCTTRMCFATGALKDEAARDEPALWIREGSGSWQFAPAVLPIPAGYRTEISGTPTGSCGAASCVITASLTRESGQSVTGAWVRDGGGAWAYANSVVPGDGASDEHTTTAACGANVCVLQSLGDVWVRSTGGPWVAASSALPNPSGRKALAPDPEFAACNATTCIAATGVLWGGTQAQRDARDVIWVYQGSGPWSSPGMHVTPVVAPRVASIRAANTMTFGRVVKDGFVALAFPSPKKGVRTTGQLRVTVKQAKALGLRVKPGAKFVVIGTAQSTSATGRGEQLVVLRLSQAAKRAIARTKSRAISMSAVLMFAQAGYTSSGVTKRLTIRR